MEATAYAIRLPNVCINKYTKSMTTVTTYQGGSVLGP